MLFLITDAARFLRWVPHHGLFVLTLFAVAVCTGTVIYLTQQARYRRSSSGITSERVTADALGVLGLASATAALGALGLYVVLILT